MPTPALQLGLEGPSNPTCSLESLGWLFGFSSFLFPVCRSLNFFGGGDASLYRENEILAAFR